jgi:hypothetical protein
VRFTLRNLKEALDDLGPRFDRAPDLEFRLATDALEILVFGAPNLGQAPPEDVDGQRDWWAE